jgi:thioredoxin reductase
VTLSYRAAGTEPGTDGVEFEFEGRTIRGRRGESLAAALIAAGEREFRITSDGSRRGLFCGMGVCQECVVEIEGRPAQRACMTKLDGSMRVRRRSFLPIARAVDDGALPDAKLQTLEPDILVLGGGAGGLNAAMAAARAGASVLLVDERPVAGALIAETAAAGVTMMQGTQVWGAFEPLDLMLFDGKGSRLCRPKRLIVATGAYERGLPVPGWTLPGVMTTGAAQTLLRSYGVLAGKKLLITGHGPLNLQVALELARAGARVVAVAELARRPGLWSAAPLLRMLASTPGLLFQGRRYVAELARRGIPLLHGHVLAGVEKTRAGLTARLGRWPAESAASPSYDVDAVLMGYGFMPSNEILRALGCRQSFDPARGHLVCERDADGLTSVATVYAVGDCAGLGGARAAEAEGAIAGLAAAISLGLSAPSDLKREVAAARTALHRHRRFQAGLWQLFAAPRPLIELAQSDTAVCRCEGLALAEVEKGFAAGPHGIGALKRATRAGMGRCQGRYCGPVLAAMAAGREGVALDEAAYWAPRPPIKPMAIADIIAGSVRD